MAQTHDQQARTRLKPREAAVAMSKFGDNRSPGKDSHPTYPTPQPMRESSSSAVVETTDSVPSSFGSPALGLGQPQHHMPPHALKLLYQKRMMGACKAHTRT